MLHYTLLLPYKRVGILPLKGLKNHIGEENKLPVEQGKKKKTRERKKKKGKEKREKK